MNWRTRGSVQQPAPLRKPGAITTISESTTMTTDELNDIGAAAIATIRDMVAATEVDFERLEELRDERDSYEPETDAEGLPLLDGNGVALTWADAFPYDAEELGDLEAAAGDCEDADDARQRIQEDPLSIRIFGERVDGEWTADRFEILLTTGGPAVRIMGELDANGELDRAWLEVQDWGTPWTLYHEHGIGEAIESYCQNFRFE